MATNAERIPDRREPGRAGSADDRRTPSRNRPTDLRTYDFRQPHRVSKERQRTLEAMYERLVKSAEGWLLGRVRGQVELVLESVQQISYGQLVRGLSTPCTSYVFEIRDSGAQQALIDFDHEFACFLVDRLFGGKGVPVVLDRPLTPMERMAVRGIAERFAALVKEVWLEHEHLDLALVGFESVPEMLRSADAQDAMLVTRIQAKIGDQTSCISICLPLAVLDSFLSETGSRRFTALTGSDHERLATRRIAEGALRLTQIGLAARLREFPISMRALTSLQPGSVLDTGIACTEPVQVLVSGSECYLATPARVGKKLALKITESLLPVEKAGSVLIPSEIED